MNEEPIKSDELSSIMSDKNYNNEIALPNDTHDNAFDLPTNTITSNEGKKYVK